MDFTSLLPQMANITTEYGNELPLFLTFDDCQIIPKYSEVNSRSEVSLKSKFSRNFNIDTPIIAAPMDTVCGINMALLMMKLKGVGVVHRFMTVGEQIYIINEMIRLNIALLEHKIIDTHLPIVAAIGVDNDLERLEKLLEAGVTGLMIDVAHGHHLKVKQTIKSLINVRNGMDETQRFDIIAGSIATARAAQDLEEWGADALRVGIGGGSSCETRIRTGIGIPQLSAIMEIAKVATIPIIADGGIRYPGDVAKAIAAGANTVMLGGLLAGTTEAPGEIIYTGNWPDRKMYKVYRGLASETTKIKIGKLNSFVEGTAALIEDRGSAKDIIEDIRDGLASALSYVGAMNMEEFKQRAELIRITSAGSIEAHPHILRR